MKFTVAPYLLVALATGFITTAKAMEKSHSKMYEVAMPKKMAAHANGLGADIMKARSDHIKQLTRGGSATCDPVTGLVAGEFPCKNMDLVYFLTGEDLGSPYASNENPRIYATWVSDIWGWVDTKNGKEYALIGMWDGTSVVDVSNPNQPVVVCFIETTGGTLWKASTASTTSGETSRSSTMSCTLALKFPFMVSRRMILPPWRPSPVTVRESLSCPLIILLLSSALHTTLSLLPKLVK
jgi:hypothetical protein